MTQPTIDGPTCADVCAVLVTYHPDSDFPGRLRRIAPQTGGTVIVDNGSSEPSLSMLREVAVSESLPLIENGANLGIALALNIGIRHALAHGYSWALLLDQDTRVDEDIVRTLLATRASFADCGRLAVVGSRFRDTHGRPAETIPLGAGGADWQEVESVITSGSLLSLQAYAAVGPFRDEFFIDYVDTEYCLRSRAAGYRVIESLTPLMSHTVGTPSQHRLLGKQKWTTNHSAERRYYIARNNTVLLREYGTSRGGSWQWKSLVRCFRLCKRIALFERDKASKIIAVAQGWWDAMRGHMGPRRAPRP
jgi:rhamnosyltransferase